MPTPGSAEINTTRPLPALRLDTEVLDWFKSLGRGHLSRMNAVLKSYVEAHKQGR